MQPEIPKYLYDIRQACRILVQFTEGNVSHARRIVNFRHVLVHGYHSEEKPLLDAMPLTVPW